MKAVAEAAAFGAFALAAHVSLGLKLAGDFEPRTGPAQLVLTLRAVPEDVAQTVADWERRPVALGQISVPAEPELSVGGAPVLPQPVSAPSAFRPLTALAVAREPDAPPPRLALLPRRPRPLMLTVRRAASVPAPPPPAPRRRSAHPDRERNSPLLPRPDVAIVAPDLDGGP